MVTDWLKCAVFGHAETVEENLSHARIEKCGRCGVVLNREHTYQHKAKKALENLGFRHGGSMYEPVEKATRGEVELEPGDKLLYTRDSAFPGIVGHRQATVKYIYKSPGLKNEVAYAAYIEREQALVSEKRWVGRRDPDSDPVPTPGLRAR